MTPTIEEGQDLVLYGVDDEIIEFIIPLFAAIRKRLDICVDYTTPLRFATEPIFLVKAYLQTDQRGFRNKIFD